MFGRFRKPDPSEAARDYAPVQQGKDYVIMSPSTACGPLRDPDGLVNPERNTGWKGTLVYPSQDEAAAEADWFNMRPA